MGHQCRGRFGAWNQVGKNMGETPLLPPEGSSGLQRVALPCAGVQDDSDTFGNKIWGNWDTCLITRSSLKDVSSALASLYFSKRPCFCRHEVTRELQLITAYACLFLKLVIPTAMEKTNQPANNKKLNKSELLFRLRQETTKPSF